MPDPWEQQRRDNIRALAAAQRQKYPSAYPEETLGVDVSQDTIGRIRQESLANQGRKYRGAFSGPASLIPSKGEEGLKIGVDEPSIAISEAAQNARDETGTGKNPFKWALKKGVMPALGAWQSATEWSAGLVSTPFSQELQMKRDAGLSPGERWRSIDLPTTRLGKAKGEGLGMDVGVKGAVELLVDPVGWALTVLPMGIIFRPLKIASKTVGKTIGSIPTPLGGKSLNKMSEIGRLNFEKKATALDRQIAPEITKMEKQATKDLTKRFSNMYDDFGKKHLGEGEGLGSLAESSTISRPKNSGFELIANWDEIVSTKNTLGYTDGILAYFNQMGVNKKKRFSGTFRAMNNVIERWRPQIASLQTPEGRIAFYKNNYDVGADHAARAMAGKIAAKDFRKLFGAEKKGIKTEVTPAIDGSDALVFEGFQDFIKIKIAKETIPFNVIKGEGKDAAESTMFQWASGAQEITGIKNFDQNLMLNMATDGTATVATRDGVRIGTFNFKLAGNQQPLGTEEMASEIIKAVNKMSPTQLTDDAVLDIKNLLNTKASLSNRRADIGKKGASDEVKEKINERMYSQRGDGNFDIGTKVEFEFESAGTAVHKLLNLGATKTSTSAPLRKALGKEVDSLTEEVAIFEKKLKFMTDEAGAFGRKQVLESSQALIKRANSLHLKTVNDYFDNLTKQVVDMSDPDFVRLYQDGIDTTANAISSKPFSQGKVDLGVDVKEIKNSSVIGNASKGAKSGDKAEDVLKDIAAAGQGKDDVLRNIGDLKAQMSDISPYQTIDEAMIGLRSLDNGLLNNQLRVTTKTGQVADLEKVFDPEVLQGLMREALRQFDNVHGMKNVDVLVNTGKSTIDSMLAKGGAFKANKIMYTKADALQGKVALRQLEQQFGKTAATIGKKTAAKQRNTLRQSFKEFYGEDLGSLEREMNVMEFLDKAGFVVGHSQSTGTPIRLFHTGYFDLSNDQIQYLEEFYQVFDDGLQLMREQGVQVENLFDFSTGNYVHHLIDDFGKVSEEFGEAVQSVTNRTEMVKSSGGNMLGKTGPTSERTFRDYIYEGFEEMGIAYSNDPNHIVEAFTRAVHTEISNTHTVNRLKVLGARQIEGQEGMIALASKFDTSGKILKGLRDFGTRLAPKTSGKEIQELYEGKIKHYQPAKSLKVDVGTGKDAIRGLSRDLDDFIDKGIRDYGDTEWFQKRMSEELAGNPEMRATIDAAIDIAEYRSMVNKTAIEHAGMAQKKSKVFLGEEKKFLDRWGKLPYSKRAKELRTIRSFRFSEEGQSLKPLEGYLFDDVLARKIEKNLNIGKKGAFESFADVAGSIGDKIRFLQTGIDAGTPMLQGLPTMFMRPDIWGKATWGMFKTMLLPNKGGQVARRAFFTEKAEVLKRMNRNGVLIGSSGSDYYRAMDDGFLSKYFQERGYTADGKVVSFAGKLGKGGRRFQAGFEDFGDRLRVGIYEAHEDQIINGLDDVAKRAYLRGEAIQDPIVRKQARELGEYVNQVTGAFSHKQAGISTQQAQFERAFVLFSPSYTRASLGLIGSVFSGGLKGKQAHKALRNMLGAGVMMHIGTAYAQSMGTGRDIEEFLHLDPSKADFLTIEVAGNKIGYGSFWNSGARALAQIVSDPAFRGDVLDSPLLLTGAGKGQAGFQEQGIKDAVANNPAVRWLRGRAAPVGSQFWDLGMGADYLGEEMSPFTVDHFASMGEQFMPFWLQAQFETGQYNNTPVDMFKGRASSLVSEFGGLRTYAEPDWEKRDEIRDMFAMQEFDVIWKDLTKAQQQSIQVAHQVNPNMLRLKELEKKISEKRRSVGGGELDQHIQEQQDMTKRINSTYDEEMANYQIHIRDRIVDPATKRPYITSPEQLIKLEKQARGDKNRAMQALKNKEMYPEFEKVYAYWESFQGFDEGEKPEDFFASEFGDIYFSETWDHVTWFDYAGRDKAIDDLKRKWGPQAEELENYARTRLFSTKKTASPLITEYYIGADRNFDNYYRQSELTVFQEMYGGFFDEQLATWKTVDRHTQKEMEERDPNFKKALNDVGALREELRKLDQSLDAFLYRFSVGGVETLMHELNDGREDELKQLEPFQVDGATPYIPSWRVAGQ